jgi:hypothetical protein
MQAIEYEKINSIKTLAYLNKHNLKTFEDLSKIVPLCYSEPESKDFNFHVKDYYFSENIEKVWQTYLNIHPNKSWMGRRIAFSFLYDNNQKILNYGSEKYYGLAVNQLIFIEIRIFFGIIKLAVTHHVSKICNETKTIKICYVKGGKSAGSQILKFIESETGTIVSHQTFYKSDSNFRDKKIYPFLHERIINHFHENVRKWIK